METGNAGLLPSMPWQYLVLRQPRCSNPQSSNPSATFLSRVSAPRPKGFRDPSEFIGCIDSRFIEQTELLQQVMRAARPDQDGQRNLDQLIIRHQMLNTELQVPPRSQGRQPCSGWSRPVLDAQAIRNRGKLESTCSPGRALRRQSCLCCRR